MNSTMKTGFTVVLISMMCVASCAKRQTPVAAPTQPPPAITTPPPITAANPPPTRVDEALPVPAQPSVSDDSPTSRPLDDLHRNSPLKPVFFAVDSADLDEAGRATTVANAEVMKKNPRWVVTIEGHCDERG